MKNFFKKYSTFFLLLLFVIALFVPRYFASAQHDAIEDEILSIDLNKNNSFVDFFLSPDISHPGLWYMLMELPTHFLDVNYGIFYYRLIQVVILFASLAFSMFYFRKKFSKTFLSVFFALFLANVYLVHLTFQHRMYSLVLGIAVFYSLFWYDLIKENDKKYFSLKTSIFLGLIASLGFFTNFSMIWIIPLWPLAYFLCKRSWPAFKTALFSSLTFLLSISWYMPHFFENTEKSIVANQWAPELNVKNVFEMIGNLLGFIPVDVRLNRLNTMVVPFLVLFIFMVIWLLLKKKNKYILQIVASLLIFFGFFILAVYITDKSLLYARTVITFAVVVYIVIADICSTNSKLIKLITFSIVILQLSQFFIYFADQEKTMNVYYLFDYRSHPIAYFKDFEFEKDSCILPMPYWNELSLRYFLGKKVRVFQTYNLSTSEVAYELVGCSKVYLLDQVSVDRTRNAIKGGYQTISELHLNPRFIESNNDQDLYFLSPE